MNLAFMGTPSFAVPSLRRLVDDGHRITTVVTAPEKKRGRGQKVADTPVGTLARSLGIRVLRPDDLSAPSFHEALATAEPEVIVVVAFRILPESLFVIPAKGMFNLHASLLPRYRGAAPIQWAILNGDTETGVTTFLLRRTVDTGGILLQERIAIGPEETGGGLHDKLADLGAEVVSKTVRLLEAGTPRVEQQDERSVSYARKIRKDDMRIDWAHPSVNVHNRIRAFAPEPGAWTLLRNKTFKVFRSSLADAGDAGALVPGTVIRASSDACVVRCGGGAVAIHEVMLEGRKRMPIAEFLRGFPLEAGTRLGSSGSLPGA